MKKLPLTIGAWALFGLMLLPTQQADAQNNPPPVGAILDLAGRPIPTTYTQYTATFTAAYSATDITFALRDDPAFLFLDDITITDETTHSDAGLLNGGFEDGVHVSGGAANEPVDWTYDNVYGATYGGQVEGGGYNSNEAYVDGAVQSYDAIDQMISTVVGHTYQISFYLDEDNGSGDTVFQDQSTNGYTSDTRGNGIDVLVYAQASIPAAVPEPSSIILLLTTISGVGFVLRKRIASGA